MNEKKDSVGEDAPFKTAELEWGQEIEVRLTNVFPYWPDHPLDSISAVSHTKEFLFRPEYLNNKLSRDYKKEYI